MNVWAIGMDEVSATQISSAMRQRNEPVECFYFSENEEALQFLHRATEQNQHIPHTIFLDVSNDKGRYKMLMKRMEEEFPHLTRRRVVLIDEPGNIDGVMKFAMNECARNILTKPVLSVEISSILDYNPRPMNVAYL